MANSTTRGKPKKPHKDFPLFPHATGYWAKKVRGKLHYFGKIENDPKGTAALDLWLAEKDYLLAGKTPPTGSDSLTVRELCNHFLTAKEQLRDAGDIQPRTFDDYYATCKSVVEFFGKNRAVSDLKAEDFQSLRGRFAKKPSPVTLGNKVGQTRMIFNYGYEAGLLDKPVRFGPVFKRPARRVLRKHRQESEPRLFESDEMKAILKAADQPLKSMVLLGINCGLGNTDCGKLRLKAVDLDNGWLNFPRVKTSVERRCPLWPETNEALKECVATRPRPKQPEDDQLFFLTKYGQPWAKDNRNNPISQRFHKLLKELAIYQPGKSFYALRHTFETIGGDSRDQVAVDHIMGHVDSSMAAHYREKIDDKRLIAVSDHVHDWLFPSEST